MSEWLDYEKLIAKIMSELNEVATVIHNDMILGFDSGTKRQIDVSIKTCIEDTDVLVIVQAKDYKRKVDITKVGEFSSVVRDVKATKGIMICNSGYTKNAMTYAQNLGIELCSIHDAETRKWSKDISLPIIWNDITPETNMRINVYFEKGDSVSRNQLEWMFTYDNGKTLFTPMKLFEEKWNTGELPHTIKSKFKIDFSSENLKIEVIDLDRCTDYRNVYDLGIEYEVLNKSWLGYFTPSECRGLINDFEDSFALSYINPENIPGERYSEWLPIDNPEELVINIKGTVVSSDGWQILSPKLENTKFSIKKID